MKRISQIGAQSLSSKVHTMKLGLDCLVLVDGSSVSSSEGLPAQGLLGVELFEQTKDLALDALVIFNSIQLCL